MPGAGRTASDAAVPALLDPEVRGRAEPGIVDLVDHRVVGLGEHPARKRLSHHRGAHRVAHQAGDGSSVGPTAADVADHHAPCPLAHLDDVVEVAADLRVGLGHPVASRRLEPGDVGQRRGQERGLQRPGHPVAGFEEPGVVQRQRGPCRHLLGQRQAVHVVATLGDVEDHGQHPDDLVPGHHRHHDRRPSAEAPHHGHVFVVDRALLHALIGDAGDEHALDPAGHPSLAPQSTDTSLERSTAAELPHVEQ